MVRLHNGERIAFDIVLDGLWPIILAFVTRVGFGMVWIVGMASGLTLGAAPTLVQRVYARVS